MLPTEWETWDQNIQFCFVFFLHSWECKYVPLKASLWILAWSATNVPAGGNSETAVVGCDEWEVREAGEFVPPAQQMISESWRCTLLSHRAWGHTGQVSPPLSICLPDKYTYMSAQAQAHKLTLSTSVELLEQHFVFKPEAWINIMEASILRLQQLSCMIPFNYCCHVLFCFLINAI